MPVAPPVVTIEQYAALQVALTEGAERETVLREFGLDEASFAAVDDAFQVELARAIDAHGDGIPPLLANYDRALRDARRTTSPPMSLEEFASITSEIAAASDPRKVLNRRQVRFDAYLRASQHWTGLLAADPDLAERFRRLIAGESSKPIADG